MQEQWIHVVAAEYKKQVDKPDEVAGGLRVGEYCITLANDQIKCADYTETLSAKLEPLVSDKYKVVISERLNDVIDGYLDVAKKCTQTLNDVVFKRPQAGDEAAVPVGVARAYERERAYIAGYRDDP